MPARGMEHRSSPGAGAGSCGWQSENPASHRPPTRSCARRRRDGQVRRRDGTAGDRSRRPRVVVPLPRAGSYVALLVLGSSWPLVGPVPHAASWQVATRRHRAVP
ncbi:hypothetical protein GQ55_6G210300 [Panicum hallii var. hallii]|uniref:Uncharacterized protein n=1 Tax=Panicum hallii var. hallii TaxID=1504633 RepID=A0A2T7D802_9POAL|nr:hypothetical protein GQ55_6G210300 [Panicum hallii var. hallii]